MSTLAIDHNTFQTITVLADQLHTSEMVVVRQAVEAYAQKIVLLKQSSPARRKGKPKLLQAGKHQPFKPFHAIRMAGDGPTASEMVIQDRL